MEPTVRVAHTDRDAEGQVVRSRRRSAALLTAAALPD